MIRIDVIQFASLISWISMRFKDVLLTEDCCVIIASIKDMVQADAIDADDINELLELLNQHDGMIPSIRKYREITGVGLMEAKIAVEKYWVNQPPPKPRDTTMS